MAEDLDPAPPPYQSRFQLIFGVLLGVALAAIAATVLFVADGKKREDPQAASWAEWRPQSKDGVTAVKQIAQHVGERYTLPSGSQLVAVRGGELELAHLPVTVAIDNKGQIEVVEGQGVMYTLCGLGDKCSIKEGKPSEARHLVLRRESLELALYTFRYVKNVDEVVVLLPPAPGASASQAMFYRRGELGASLTRPLRATLPGRPPPVNKLTKAEGNFLDRLTAPNLFKFTPREGQDAHVYLVLQPLLLK